MRLARLVLIAVALFLPAVAQAQIVSFDFQARVTTTSGSPYGLSPSFNDLITGSFSFDMSSPIFLSGSTFAVYSQTTPSSFSMVLNGVTIETSTFGVMVEDGSSDGFQVSGGFGSGMPGSEFSVGGIAEPDALAYFVILDTTGGVYSGTGLPGSFTLSDFDVLDQSLFLENIPGGGGFFNFEIFEVTPSAVPEPSTYALLGLAAVAGLWYRRSKARTEG
jgi:hypothetical protein